MPREQIWCAYHMATVFGGQSIRGDNSQVIVRPRACMRQFAIAAFPNSTRTLAVISRGRVTCSLLFELARNLAPAGSGTSLYASLPPLLDALEEGVAAA